MKSIYTSFLLLILSVAAVAQNNSLIVYSQDGFKFSLILNGVLQNEHPTTNVKVTSLNAPNYEAKVIFENKMADVNGTIYLMYGGNNTQNTEYTYSIAYVKDKYKLKFKSIAPIAVEEAEVPNPQQTVVVYTPVPIFGTNISTTTTTNTVQTNTNVGGVQGGININFNVNDPTMIPGGTVNSTTYSTSTTTVNSGGYASPNNNNAYVLPGYSGIYGCPYPMGPSDFESAKQSISSKGFDESKLTIAKQIIGSNCMLCAQIRELMDLMSFEATKLDLAKFAWNHNLDKGNYYKLNDAFTFESSIDELNKYTQSHK